MEGIFIPASGMAAEDVLVSEWLKEPGDQVASGEPVAVVETDKATVELSGTTAGRLPRHLVEAGFASPAAPPSPTCWKMGRASPVTVVVPRLPSRPRSPLRHSPTGRMESGAKAYRSRPLHLRLAARTVATR